MRRLARVFTDAGAAVYAVGGYVRNTLLDLPLSDIDVCSRLTPPEVEALMQNAGWRTIDQGARYGTVAILLPDGEKLEHTTFRTDSYAEGGAHRPEQVCFGDSLEQDAFRRDFTVNALYADLSDGRVYDPTGGLADLDNGVLRATGASPDVIMGSDALRVLRLVRFSAELGFTIDEATWESAKRHASKLSDISAERIRAELDKILLSDTRYGRNEVLRALHKLDELRALDVFWPETAEGRGHKQRREVHRYTVLEHCFHVCGEMPPELPLRLAGLLHDVGKPKSFRETGKFYEHAEMSAVMAQDMLERLRYDNATIRRAVNAIARHMYDIQGTARNITLRTAFAEWGREGTADVIAMREADVRGCGYDAEYVAERWRTLFQVMQQDGTPFTLSELKVSGEDVMEAGVSEGPAVGEALMRLRQHCIGHPRDNKRERLLKLLVNNPPAK